MNHARLISVGLLLLSGTVAPGQEGFDLARRPNGPYEIRGTVVDAMTKQPLGEVEINIQDSNAAGNATFEIIQSDANGSFRFRNLPEGKYALRAERQGYSPTAFLQHENYWSGVVVGPGKDSVHIIFPMNASALITGRVTDEAGEDVRNASVTLWTEARRSGRLAVEQGQTVTTNDEGRYRLEHLPAGKYSASVQATPWYSRYASSGTEAPTDRADVVYPTLFYPSTRDWHAMEWIDLEAGETGTADFHLTAEPSAHLRMPAETGPVLNVSVLNDLPSGTAEAGRYKVTTLEDGMIEISGIAAGHYQIAGEGKQSEELEVSGNSEVQLAAVEGSGSIDGLVRGEDAETNLDRGLVQLRDAEGHAYVAQFRGEGEVKDQPARSFSFAKIPSGALEFELSVIEPGDLLIRKVEGEKAKIVGAKIRTDGSEKVHLLVTVGRVSSAISGVAVKQGNPVAGAMILLMPEGGKNWETLVRRDQSDSDGTFRLAAIFPGKYQLLALEHGWELEWSEPAVLRPFLAKAVRVEISERQSEQVRLEVQ